MKVIDEREMSILIDNWGELARFLHGTVESMQDSLKVGEDTKYVEIPLRNIVQRYQGHARAGITITADSDINKY